MTTKKPKAGGEIDSYCTRCKLDLTHRIIAMVGDTVKKVECKTCGSHHLYRKPKSEKASEKTPVRAAAAPKAPKAERISKAAKAERDATVAWESAIAGQPSNAFKPYRLTQSFGAGELVRHPKFGDGVVARVIDRGKVEILFQDGPRTMAQGQD